jgi:uncharacterized membrane protein
MMRFFHPLLLLILLAPLTAASAAPKGDGTKLAGRVHEIFEVKCIDCHGPELPRPKGKFGYVLDLKRVAANSDYIVPGHPEKSDLYDMVFKEDMPGEDANVPPLTKDEKEIVRRWIELGAPEPDASTTSDHSAASTLAGVEQKPRMPFWKQALRYVGRFHPVSTHFPVALMLVAVFAEGLAWWTRRESWLQTVRFLVLLAALGAIAAVVLGWINAWFTSYTGQLAGVLRWHRWLGTTTAVWALLCAGLVMMNDCKEGTKDRQRFRGALLLGAALVGISGFLGSALIYGLDHYAWK